FTTRACCASGCRGITSLPTTRSGNIPCSTCRTGRTSSTTPPARQEGYSAFSVSQSQRKTVVDYIDHQAEHHAKWSFEQEFLTLLKKSGISYDPRFVLG